jgi:hypothetical protein
MDVPAIFGGDTVTVEDDRYSYVEHVRCGQFIPKICVSPDWFKPLPTEELALPLFH